MIPLVSCRIHSFPSHNFELPEKYAHITKTAGMRYSRGSVSYLESNGGPRPKHSVKEIHGFQTHPCAERNASLNPKVNKLELNEGKSSYRECESADEAHEAETTRYGLHRTTRSFLYAGSNDMIACHRRSIYETLSP